MTNFLQFLKRIILPPITILVLFVILLGFLIILTLLMVEVMKAETLLYQKLSLIVLLAWIALLISYYAWLIYFYNYNYGKSSAFWRKFKAMAKDPNGKQTEAQLYKDLAAPVRNPFYDQTFGLPPGTVRGTLALTVVVGGMCLLILVIGGDANFIRLGADQELNFFEQAFLMVIAFYFGTKAFDIIQKQQTERIKAKETKSEAPTDVFPAEEGFDDHLPESQALPQEMTPLSSLIPPKQNGTPKADKKETVVSENLRMFYPHVKDIEESNLLQEEEIKNFAKEWDLDVAAIRAVIKVESSGKGFLKDGRPKILFEGHVFWRQLKKHGENPESLASAHPTILYPNWTRQHYLTGGLEYNRLNEAKLIHEAAALESASWGMFQIMGFNCYAMGYDTVQAFVADQEKSEEEHLKAFGLFISKVSPKCLEALKKQDWATFARHYNGPQYAKNQYDTRLADWYQNFRKQYA